MVPISLRKLFMRGSQLRAKVISPKRHHWEDTMNGKKSGKMHAWSGLPTVDVHRGNRWSSSFLQMPASMGNCYYPLVSSICSSYIQLTWHTYCSLSWSKKTVGSLGGSIIDQFIRISSTSTTYRTKSSIYKGKLAAGTRKTKTMTTTMVQVHRRHSAMIHIAPALITRTRGLRRHPRHHHHQ